MSVDVEQITAKAVNLKPVRVFMWLIAAPFVLVGLVLRLLWLAPAFLISAGVEGWQSADKLVKQWRAQARDAGRAG